MRRLGRIAGLLLLLLIVLAGGAFALLQTSLGMAWLGRTAAQALSSPGAAMRIAGLGGTAPFRLHARQVDISDADGAWLVLDDVHLDISAAALVTGRIRFTRLTAASAALRRLPQTPPPAQPEPIAERLRPPHLSYPLAIDRLAVGELRIAAPVLGEPIVATLAGNADLAGDRIRAGFDVHRTDGTPGRIALDLSVAGAPPMLRLRLAVNEPTGVLLDRLLHRTDRPPLSVSVTGEGPLSAWHGRLAAAAGDLARIDGDLSLAAAADLTLSLSARAVVAKLLPPDAATLIGDRVPLSLRATVKQNGAVALDVFSLAMAAGTLTADGEFGRPDHTIAARVHADLPHLKPAAAALGVPVGGTARLDATIGGSEERPTLDIEAAGDAVQVGASRVAHATARLRVASDPAKRVTIAAQGRLAGLQPPPGIALPSGVSRDIDWSLTAQASRDLAAVDLTGFTAHGAGIDVMGSGRVSQGGRSLNGQLRVAVADLRPFTGALGSPIAGALTLQATAAEATPDLITAAIDGSVTGFASGIPALDALAGKAPTLTGTARRGADGAIVIDRLRLTGAAAQVAASGRFDPASRQLTVTLDSTVPELRPLGRALATAVNGRLALHASVAGPLDHLAMKARLDGSDVAADNAKLDRLTLTAQIADLATPRATVDGSFRSGDLDATLALAADATDPRDLAIPRLRLAAGGGAIDGALHIDPVTWLARGAIGGTLPNLARWSRLAGTPLAGRLSVNATLAARRGQSLDLRATGEHVAVGSGASQVALGHVALAGSFNDLRGLPWGKAHADLTGTSFPGGAVRHASLTIDSARPGHLAFTADAAGKLAEPFTVSLGGTAEVTPHLAGIDLRLARLQGALGRDRIALDGPVRLVRRAGDVTVSDLALRFGSGRITGSGSWRGTALSLHLAAHDLSVAAAARLAGHGRASGSIGFDATLAGTLRAPHGRFSLTGRKLSLSLSPQQRLGHLGLDLSGTWDGRRLAFNGGATGLKGDTLTVDGGLPLVLTPEPLRVAIPSNGALALRLRGGGELADVADLLPLGEDRLSGHFAIDAAIGGTPAAPTGDGRLTITDGRYASFATGAVLTGVQLDLVGNRDRFTLRRFAAGDGADGKLDAEGSLVLDGPHGPNAELRARLDGFRLMARDEATVTASGTVAVGGPLAAPKVTADLTADKGEFRIPDKLPPSIARLQVVDVGGPAGAKPEAASPPALAMPLDVKIALPGRIFVRGHGLDSEWRGRLHITGTSAAPQIRGALDAVRGTFDLLGKSFKVTQGRIAFAGGAKLDPALNITTEVTAGGITAQVVLGGFASAPTVTLTSTPVLPQDEVLARVLFDRPLGQISVGEGLQVAQAAAALAGGGPGLLDQLRNRLGLDRLVFGSTPGATSIAGSATVSGGKYIGNGIYVGATQGLTAQSSKVTVEIELRPHVTLETDLGATGGAGIGLNYKYDY